MKKFLQICILTYKRLEFLKKNCLFLINEIQRNNLEKEIGIFIGEDGGDDGTLEFLKSLSQKYPNIISFYSNRKNLGLPANTFKMIEEASGEYLWFLSDDDFIKKGALKKIIYNLKKYKPDSYFFDYFLVRTDIKKFKFSKISSILAPGWKLKNDLFLASRKSFFKQLVKTGFYNFRMALAQQSILISKGENFKKGLELIKKMNYDLTKESYPVHLSHLMNLRKQFFIDVKNKVMITANNRSWNADILKANKVVRDFFDPMLFMILKKYGSEIPLKGKLYIYFSPIYSYMVFLITSILSLLKIDGFLYKIQFGGR